MSASLKTDPRISKLIALCSQSLGSLLYQELQNILPKLGDYLSDRLNQLEGDKRQQCQDLVIHFSTLKVVVADMMRHVEQDLVAVNAQLDDKNDELELQAETLTLMDYSDLDVSLSIERALAKLPADINELMNDAFFRVNYLESKITSPHQLPFHPQHLVRILLSAIRPDYMGAFQGMVIVKFIVTNLNFLLLNKLVPDLLRKADIPEMAPRDKTRSAPIRREVESAPARAHSETVRWAVDPKLSEILKPSTHQGSIVIDPNGLERLSQLFETLGHSQHTMSAFQGGVLPAAPNYDELLGRLQRLEQELLQNVVSASTTQTTQLPQQGIKQQLDEVINRYKTEMAISPKDNAAIDLVSILFDCIFEDANLPDFYKSLISRLQIPYLRIALADDTIFSNELHPARVLLNQMSKQVIGLDQHNKSDALFSEIESIVERLHVAENSLKEVTQMSKSFERFVQMRQINLDTLEKKTIQQAENQSRVEEVKRYVQHEMHYRLQNKRFPYAVSQLIQDGWWTVLYQTVLRYGVEAESTKQHLRTLDVLIWALQPNVKDDKWVSTLSVLREKLIKSIHAGLGGVGYDAFLTQKYTKELDLIFDKMLDGIHAGGRLLIMSTQATVTMDMIALPEQNMDAASSESQLLPAAVFGDLAEVIVPSVTMQYTVPIMVDEYLTVVQDLPIGTWVEFMQAKDNQRLKLVARVRAMSKLVFTNLKGIKAAEISEDQLAIDLRQQRARIINIDTEIFDRALRALIERLNSSLNRAS